ncbi:MAG: SH3 domain-containing protein [Mesorhizobium sp.]
MLGLPKLRWLVVGAVAAGAWAMTQEPPGPPERRPVARTEPAVVRAPAARPATRPAPIIATGSIRRPERPLAAQRTLWTRERVRLRAEPSTEARVVVWLRAGERVAVTERSGVWHRVSAAGHKGWVHGDYLAAGGPQPPRPKATVAAARPSMSVPVPSPAPPTPLTEARAAAQAPTSPPAAAGRGPFSLFRRPARAPQHGDCQCPYDLMMSGKACGDHSAYVMHGRTKSSCYL